MLFFVDVATGTRILAKDCREVEGVDNVAAMGTVFYLWWVPRLSLQRRW